QPKHAHETKNLGHAYGFIYRRLLKDKPLPLVPVLVNTFYPPNQPLPRRCFDFGRAIGRAIARWPEQARVAATGFKMKLLDYVPCYRSEAGTGNAMAFATWSSSS